MSTDASLLRSWSAELAAIEHLIRGTLLGVFASDAVRRVEADAVAIADDLLARAGFDPDDTRFCAGMWNAAPAPMDERREEEHTDELLTAAVSTTPAYLEGENEIDIEIEIEASLEEPSSELSGIEPGDGWITYDEVAEDGAAPEVDAPPQADPWMTYEDDEQPTNSGVKAGPKMAALVSSVSDDSQRLSADRLPTNRPDSERPPAPAAAAYMTHAKDEPGDDVIVHEEDDDEITGIFDRPPKQDKARASVRTMSEQFQPDVDSAVTLDTELASDLAAPEAAIAPLDAGRAALREGQRAAEPVKRAALENDEFELVVDDMDLSGPNTEDEADDASDAEVVQTSASSARPTPSAPPAAHATTRARATLPTPDVARVAALRPVSAAPAAVARATAGLYGSAAVPTIRDSQEPRPKAAAIQINAAVGSSKVLGLEEEEEPLEIGSAEDYGEEEPDDEPVSGGGFRINLQEYEEVEVEAADEPDEATGPMAVPQPAFPTGPSQAEITSMLARARAAEEGGLLDEGISLYADVLDADPDNIDARVGRGRLYLDRGDFARAMSDFMVAEEIGPQHPEPQIAIGDLHFARKDYRKAIDYFDLALSLAPKSAKAYCRRGISHYWRKAYPQALTDLATAQKLDPETANIGTYITMVKKKMKK